MKNKKLYSKRVAIKWNLVFQFLAGARPYYWYKQQKKKRIHEPI